MKKIFTKYIAPFAMIASPVAALAQPGGGVPGGAFGGFINTVYGVVNNLIPLMIGIALLVFLIGIIRYVIAKGPEAKGTAIGTIVWGLIGLFVMVAVWGLVRFLKDSLLGGASTDPIGPPGF